MSDYINTLTENEKKSSGDCQRSFAKLILP